MTGRRTSPAPFAGKVIDLSHCISPGMPVFPGTAPPAFAQLATVGSRGFAETSISVTTHTGTHLDAPAHILEGGRALDRLPPEGFVGSGAVVDAAPAVGLIGPDELAPLLSPASGVDFLLLRTGWSRHWGTPAYQAGYPVLALEAARRLATLPLKGIGIDAPSFDEPDAAAFPVHRLLLERGIVLIENLTNLSALPPSGFLFVCLPLRIEGGDGSPVRAVAILPRKRSR